MVQSGHHNYKRMNEELLRELFTKYNLSSKGDFNTFKNDMQDEKVAKQFFDGYSLNKKGDFNTFKSDLGIGQPGLNPSVNNQINSYLAELESNNDYTAMNPNTSATGKYQHMWSQHKRTINNLTGITSQQEYLRNPQAQEKVQQYFNQEYLKNLPELRQRANAIGANFSDEELIYLNHHSGLGGARNYLEGKYVADHAGLEGRLMYGREKGFTKALEKQQAQLINTQLGQDQAAAKALDQEAVDIVEKKNKEKYSKLNLWEKGMESINRKGVWGSLVDLGVGAFNSNVTVEQLSLYPTDTEKKEAKKQLLHTDKYRNLWNTKEDVAKLLDGSVSKDPKEHLKIANDLQKDLQEDINTNAGIFDAFSGHDYKTENGVEMVNLTPLNPLLQKTQGLPDVWVPLDQVKNLTTHPLADKITSTTGKRLLNEKLNSIQADLTKRDRYIKENIVDKEVDFVNVLENSIKNIQQKLESKYPKNQQGQLEIDPRDPLAIRYQQEIEQYNTTVEGLKQYDPEVKMDMLFNTNRKARVQALDNDYKNLEWYEKAGNAILYRSADLAKKAYNLPRSTGQFAQAATNLVFDTNFGATEQISDAYDDDKLQTSAASKAVRKVFQLEDGRKIEYDSHGSLVGLLDNNDYSIDISKEELQQLEKSVGASYLKSEMDINSGGVASGVGELVTDLPLMFVGSGVISGALKILANTSTIGRYAAIAKTANSLAASDRLRSFTGAYAAFYDQITEGAIKEGGLTTGREIAASGILKTALEATIDAMINPIEGKLLSGKLWDNLSKAQVKEFTKRALAGEPPSTIVQDIVKQSSRAFTKQSALEGAKTLLNTAVQGGAESLEEVVAAIAEPEIVNRILNNWLDVNYNTNANIQEISEGALVGFAGGLAMGGVMNILQNNSYDTKDTILRNSIRASLQHSDLFNSTLTDLFENKKKRLTEELVNDQQKLTESLELLERSFKKVTDIHKGAKAIVESKGIFKGSDIDGFIPSQGMQTAYSNAAFMKAYFDDIDVSEVQGLEEVRDYYNSLMDDLDLFKKNRYNGFVSINDVNSKLSDDDRLSDKLLKELTSNLRERVETEIAKLAKTKVSDSKKIDVISAALSTEISKLKNGQASEELQSKYDEAKKRLDDEKIKLEELKKQQEERELLNNSYKDFVNNRALTVEDIANKYKIDKAKAEEILSQVQVAHQNKKLQKYNEIYNAKVKKLTESPDIFTEDDIQSIINAKDIVTAPNLNDEDVDEIYSRIIEKFNNPDDKAMVDAMAQIRDKAGENFFKRGYEAQQGVDEIGRGKLVIARVPGQKEFRIVNKGKNFGKKASREDYILATAFFLDDISTYGNSPLWANLKIGKTKGTYVYNVFNNSWEKLIENESAGSAFIPINFQPKSMIRLKNIIKDNFDELFDKGVIDFTGQEVLDIINKNTKDPLKKVEKNQQKPVEETEEEVLLEYIQDKLNDALTDASLDPNLEENRNYNTKRVMDFVIGAINTESILYKEHANDPVVIQIKEILDNQSEEVVDSSPMDAIYSIIIDPNKTSEFINIIYNYVVKSQNNAEAKFNWTNSIAKDNQLKNRSQLLDWLRTNTVVNYDIDIDYIKIHFSSKDVTIANNKIVHFNNNLIGKLPVNLIYTDKTTGNKYYSFMHDSNYFKDTSRFDESQNAIDKSEDRIKEYKEERRNLITASGITEVLFDKYVQENNLDKFPPAIKSDVAEFINIHYIKTHSGKNLLNLSIDDFENVVNVLKKEIYDNRDNLDKLSSKIIDLSKGHFEYNEDGEFTKVSELTSDQGNTIHSIEIIKKDNDSRGTPGSVIANVISPNLSSAHLFLLSDPYTVEETQALKNLIKEFLTADQPTREEIRKIVRLFVYDNDKGDNFIKLVVDNSGKEKPFIKIGIGGNQAEFNTKPDNKFNEQIDKILDRYFKDNPNKSISDVFLTKEVDSWKSTPVKLILDKKVLFDSSKYASYEEYVKTVTSTNVVSLDFYQSNIQYRATPTTVETSKEEVLETPTVQSSETIITSDTIDDSEYSTSFIGQFKKISNEVIEGDLKWLNNVLPQIGVQKHVADNITSDVEVLGAFVSSLEILDNFGANYGIYYTDKTKLNSNRSQIRHEAFEAVFALYTTDIEKNKLIDAAKKRYNAPNKFDLDLIAKTYPSLTPEQVVDKWYKEQLADEFNEYQYTEPKNIIERFFQKLKDLINNFLGRKDIITSLFNNINAGKFAGKPINKTFIKDVKEYSTTNKNVTEETARKIGKSLASIMITTTRKSDGKYVFIDMDNINHNDVPIIAENVYNPDILMKVYSARVKEHINDLINESEKKMYKDLLDLHLLDFQTDKLIYKATIVEFNKILKIKDYTPEEEVQNFFDNNEEESDSRDGKQYDIASYETDFKSNQYPAIKLLLHSIKDPDGKILGKDAPIVETVPYEVMNNLLVLLFADKYSGSNDIDAMIEDIRNFQQYRPEFKQIYQKLIDWKNKGLTHLLNQFANSFTFEKFNFTNVISKEESLNQDETDQYINPEEQAYSKQSEVEVTSIIQQISKDPVDTLEERWERYITNLFINFDVEKEPIKQVVNKEAKQKIETLKKLLNNSTKFNTAFTVNDMDSFYGLVGTGLQMFFKELNIKFNTKAARLYFEKFGTGDNRRDLEVLLESLNLLVADTTKTEDKFKRDITTFINPSKNKVFEDDYGELKFQINENVVRNLIRSQLIFEDQVLENTILSGSVRKWIYGLPSFLSQQLLELQNNKEYLNSLSSKLYHKRSLILNAMKDGFKPQLSDLDNLSVGGEDINLSDPRLVEDIYASIQNTLSTKGRPSGTPASVRLLSFNSHKRNNINITIPKFYSFNPVQGVSNRESVKVIRGYFLDEYERILTAIDSENSAFKPFKNLSKNSLSSSLFPELSYNYKGKPSKELKKLRDMLYSPANLDLNNNTFIKNKDLVDDLDIYINNELIKVVEDQKEYLKSITNDNLKILFPSNILSKYETTEENAINRAIGDYTVMGIIGAVEHTKVFIGDPAQYKGLIDLTKRTHSTSSSGMQYTLPFDNNYVVIKTQKKSSQYYNDEYAKEVLFDVRKREWEQYKESGDVNEIPSDDDIREEVENTYKDVKKLTEDGEPISRAYGDIDDTDAFAEVTLPMWREMLKSIGRWNDNIHDKIYDSLLKGEITNEDIFTKKNGKKGIVDILSTLQPVKTVQFGTSLLNNELLAMSTYHKWALVPTHPAAFTKGSERQKRYNLAVYGKLDVDYAKDSPLPIEKQVHFYLYDSATKGTNNTQKFISGEIDNTTFDINAGWNNNIQQIPSWTMKLQNDLSAKFFKKTKVQEGSQFRKNVFQNIQYNRMYNIPESTESKTGAQLLSEMQDIDSSISNRKLDKFLADTAYDVEKGTIGNKKQFTDFILEELQRRTPTDNLLNYLKNNEFNINVLPQFKSLFENIYSSINRNRIIKSEVTGGSFIEIPETGLTGKHLLDATTDQNYVGGDKLILLNGFSIGKNGKLKGPTFEKNSETGELSYRPSLVFLPHHLVRALPKEKRTAEYLNELFKNNPKLLRGLGYRIPNQGASSIDSFQIAGILPDYMGDSIVVYQDITTKYGSDYDIDKMYVSLYNFKYDGKTLKTVPYYTNPTEEQNLELYEEYINRKLKDNDEYKQIQSDIKREIYLASKLADNLSKNKDLKTDTELRNIIINDVYNYLNDNSEGNEDDIDQLLFTNYIDVETLDNIKTKVSSLLTHKDSFITKIKTDFSIDKFNELSIYDKHSDKALQNRKMDIYRAIIESEVFHFENIAPLDKWVEPIKKAITELYNKDDNENNDAVQYKSGLGFFTTTEQLKIKNINNNAKKALAIAANSGVALPFQRQAGMKYVMDLGNDMKEIDFTKIFDAENRLISQRISAGYLSAFLDADKDPYIIFANINTFTYPIVDTLIRIEIPEKQIIQFMAQPVIREILFTQNFESPLLPVSEKALSAIEKVANKYTTLAENSAINITESQDFKKLFKKYFWDANSNSTMSKKLKNNVYSVNVKGEENILTPLENLEILYLFNQLKLHASIIADSITSTKYSVSAGGATFNEALVKYEATRKNLGLPLNLMIKFTNDLRDGKITDKFIKEINSYSPVYNFVNLYVKKENGIYKPTSEGTYFLNSAAFLKDFSKGDNITQHPVVSTAIYNIHSRLGKMHITDPQLVTKIKNAAYTFLINRSLMSKPLEINGKKYNITPGLVENLFKIGKNKDDKNTFLTRIFNDDFKEIAPTLVDVLIPKKIFKSNKSLSFVRADNFKTSDISIKNQIIKEVESIIENDRKRNTNPSTKNEARNDSLALLLYSFYSSGFTFDSSSFFDLLPLELTEKLINVSNLYEHLSNFEKEFEDQFFRSNYHDSNFVQILEKNPFNYSIGAAVVNGSNRMITGLNEKKQLTYKPFISYYNKKSRDFEMYSFYGKYIDKGTDKIERTKLVYTPISKLGYKTGRFKITELGTNANSWLNAKVENKLKRTPKNLESLDNIPVLPYIKDINKIDPVSIGKNAIKVVPLQKDEEVKNRIQIKTPKVKDTKEDIDVRSVANIPQNLVSGKEAYGTLQHAKPEVKKVLGENPHSIDMIEAGFRTRTTRSAEQMEKYNVKVGDIINNFGKSADRTTKNIPAKVIAIHPKGTPEFLGTWDKEGWTKEGIEAIERYLDGAAAIEFEVVTPIKPSDNKNNPDGLMPIDRSSEKCKE